MSFGKHASSIGIGGTSTSARAMAGRRAHRRRRRQARRRIAGALAMAVTFGLLGLFYTAQGAFAADDEPDLLPFWGAFAVGCTFDNGCSNGHHGSSTPAVDFPMPQGTAVLAAGNGVARLYEDACAGKYIEVWHAGVRKYSRYLHLSSYAVRDGERVSRGQIIARSGNTGASGGCSTGPHLHYDELNAAHHRVDPGPMVGWSGGVWTSYPSALGASGWSRLAAFTAPVLRNDYTITAGTPTTILTTSTTVPVTAPPATSPGPQPTTVPSPTATTAPPQPPAPPTATTAPPVGGLAEGTLFRGADMPNIYVMAGGSPWWVPNPHQLELLGGWGNVRTVAPQLDSALSALPWRALDDMAFVEAGSPQMYWCSGGSPWPVASMAELAALNAAVGASGWARLPGGAGVGQWACGGTLPGTVFQARGGADYWVWTGADWNRFGDAGSLGAAGYGGVPVELLPAG